MNKKIENKQIVWEKFVNPLELADLEDEDVYEDDGDMKFKPNKKYKVLVSDHGIIPLMGSESLKEVFNFWVGHTNFNISYPICELISKTPGIESFQVMSPLRMRIAVGKLFPEHDVMTHIGNKINKFFKDLGKRPKTKQKSKKSISQLLSNVDIHSVPWLMEVEQPHHNNSGVPNGHS